jgi:hypothetical protein
MRENNVSKVIIVPMVNDNYLVEKNPPGPVRPLRDILTRDSTGESCLEKGRCSNTGVAGTGADGGTSVHAAKVRSPDE